MNISASTLQNIISSLSDLATVMENVKDGSNLQSNINVLAEKTDALSTKIQRELAPPQKNPFFDDFKKISNEHFEISIDTCDDADALIGELRRSLGSLNPAALQEIMQLITSNTNRVGLFLLHKFFALGLDTFTTHTINAISSSREQDYSFLTNLLIALSTNPHFKNAVFAEAKRFMEIPSDKAQCARYFSELYTLSLEESHVPADFLVRHLGGEQALSEILKYNGSLLIIFLETIAERYLPSQILIDTFDSRLDEIMRSEPAPRIGDRLRAMRALAGWNIASGNNEIKGSRFFEQAQNKILAAFIHRKQMPHQYSSYNISGEAVHSFIDDHTREVRSTAYSHLKSTRKQQSHAEFQDFTNELKNLAKIARLKSWMEKGEPARQLIDLINQKPTLLKSYYELKPEDWHNFHFDLCMACLFTIGKGVTLHKQNYLTISEIFARLLSYPHITPTNNEAFLTLLLHLEQNPGDSAILRPWLKRPERSKGFSEQEEMLLKKILIKYHEAHRITDYLDIRPFLPDHLKADFENKHSFSNGAAVAINPFLAKEFISYQADNFANQKEKSIQRAAQAFYLWKDDLPCIQEIMRFAGKIEAEDSGMNARFWNEISIALYEAKRNTDSNRTFKAIYQDAPPRIRALIDQEIDEFKVDFAKTLIPQVQINKEFSAFDDQLKVLIEMDPEAAYLIALKEGHTKTVQSLVEEWSTREKLAAELIATYDFVDTYTNIDEFFQPIDDEFQVLLAKIKHHQDFLTEKFAAHKRWMKIHEKLKQLEALFSGLNALSEQLNQAAVRDSVNAQKSKHETFLQECHQKFTDDMDGLCSTLESYFPEAELQLRLLNDRVQAIEVNLKHISGQFDKAIFPFVQERRQRETKMIAAYLDTSLALAPSQMEEWKSPIMLQTTSMPRNYRQIIEEKNVENKQLKDEIERLKALLATNAPAKSEIERQPEQPTYKGIVFSDLWKMTANKVEKMPKARRLLDELQNHEKCTKQDLCKFLTEIGMTMHAFTGSHQSVSYQSNGRTVQGTNFTLATHDDMLDPQGCKDAFAAINIALDHQLSKGAN